MQKVPLPVRGLTSYVGLLVPKSIFIADDSEQARRAIRKLFESVSSFEICGEAENGVDALEKVNQLGPDLLILDFSMPRMSGLEVARRLREEKNSIRIILFTWYADVLPPQHASDLGLTLVSKDAIGSVLVRAATSLLGASA